MPDRPAQNSPQPPRRNGLEWAVFALGLALTTGVVGWLGYDALRGGSDRPDLRLALGAPVEAHGQVLVPVRVTNAGGRAGKDVRVEVCRPGPPEECAEIAFAYVPRGSFREGEVGFKGAAGPFAARVVSFLQP